MTEKLILKDFVDAIINMDITLAKNICLEAISKEINPFKIIQEGIVEAVSIIGDKFEKEEFFLPELIMAGEIIKEVMKILDPHIRNKEMRKALAKVLIGTGKGDLHDIGKGIVKIFLEAEGFEVIDLGVDISPEQYVEAVRTEKPKVLAISILISTAMPEINNTIKALEKANLRDNVKILIGGAPVSQDFVDYIGADAYAPNAIEGVRICKRWIET